MALTDKLIAIADKIRELTGITEKMTLDEFPSKMDEIKTNPILQDKSVTITINGTKDITADEGYDGLNNVEVVTNVAGGEAPTKGFIVSAYDSNGYATDITVVGLTSIPAYYFHSYNDIIANALTKNVTNINLPDDITSIGTYAFHYCYRLKTINLPNGITSIPDYTFNQCQNLTLRSLPENITNLGSYAFYNCKKLALTSLPTGITSIGSYCFYNNTLLALTSLPEDLTYISEYSFQDCTNLALTSLPESVTSIGQYAFYRCSKLALTSLPNSITSISTHAFNTCSKLALTSLPENLTTIGSNAFQGCTNLAIKTLPDGVTTLGGRCFGGCTGIKQISSNTLRIFGGSSSSTSSFSSCTGLKAVWIPSTVTNGGIGRYVFSGCTNINKIYIDLPRATVEGFSNYSYAFSNNAVTTDVIVCNDDTDFITKEQFDTIDWATYTA